MSINITILTSDENISDLCSKYWELESPKKFTHSVASIMKEFKVAHKELYIILYENCHVYDEEYYCNICNEPVRLTSRTNYLESFSRRTWHSYKCKDCEYIQLEEQAKIAKNINEQIYQRVNEIFMQRKETGLDLEKFSFYDAVYLLSLLRVGATEDLSHIVQYNQYTQSLSPTKEYDSEILIHLKDSGIICVHPNSEPSAIELDEDSFTFYMLRVNFSLTLSDYQESPKQFYEKLESIFINDEWPDRWFDESDELQRQIAFYECIQYLEIVLNDHGFNLKLGEKTSLVIKNTLRSFSVAQIYNFIWGAVKDAASFHLRENTSKQHAANIVPGAIQRKAERALIEGWDIKSFKRDFRAPQSKLSEVLYYTALKIGDKGFEQPPPDKQNEPEKNI